MQVSIQTGHYCPRPAPRLLQVFMFSSRRPHVNTMFLRVTTGGGVSGLRSRCQLYMCAIQIAHLPESNSPALPVPAAHLQSRGTSSL